MAEPERKRPPITPLRKRRSKIRKGRLRSRPLPDDEDRARATYAGRRGETS